MDGARHSYDDPPAQVLGQCRYVQTDGPSDLTDGSPKLIWPYLVPKSEKFSVL